MGISQFFEDIKFGGGDKVRNFIFEEEFISLPTIVTKHDQASVLDIA